MSKKSKAREQFYKAYAFYQYPDVVHVKKDSYHSDIVCLKEFGSAYMEVVNGPQGLCHHYTILPLSARHGQLAVSALWLYLPSFVNPL
jgi:hypothetical protein